MRINMKTTYREAETSSCEWTIIWLDRKEASERE